MFEELLKIEEELIECYQNLHSNFERFTSEFYFESENNSLQLVYYTCRDSINLGIEELDDISSNLQLLEDKTYEFREKLEKYNDVSLFTIILDKIVDNNKIDKLCKLLEEGNKIYEAVNFNIEGYQEEYIQKTCINLDPEDHDKVYNDASGMVMEKLEEILYETKDDIDNAILLYNDILKEVLDYINKISDLKSGYLKKNIK